MMRSRFEIVFGIAVFCGFIGAATSATAQTHSRVTVDKAVTVAGKVLAPGVYDFATPRNGMTVVQIRSGNGQFSIFVRVSDISRPRRGAVIGLHPSAAGEMAELATWYPNGGTEGFGFGRTITGTNAVTAIAQPTLAAPTVR
jgi:hypothetical protein